MQLLRHERFIGVEEYDVAAASSDPLYLCFKTSQTCSVSAACTASTPVTLFHGERAKPLAGSEDSLETTVVAL